MSFAEHVAAMRKVLEAHGVTNLPQSVLLDLATAAPTYQEYWTDDQVATYVRTIEPRSVRTWAFKHKIPRERMLPADQVRDTVAAIRDRQANRRV